MAGGSNILHESENAYHAACNSSSRNNGVMAKAYGSGVAEYQLGGAHAIMAAESLANSYGAGSATA